MRINTGKKELVRRKKGTEDRPIKSFEIFLKEEKATRELKVANA